MNIHKIQIDDFYCDNFEVIAIHTSVEDYKLAYLLNQALGIQLSKLETSIELNNKDGKSNFEIFIYEDSLQDISWSLIKNQSILVEKNKNARGLFDTVEIKSFLISEVKKADYILKIENTDKQINISTLGQKIGEISVVSTAYPIDIANFKSKNNLIF